MSTMMKGSEFVSRLGDSCKAVAKIVLLSRRATAPRRCEKKSDKVVILANGPSLKTTIEQYGAKLLELPTVAVNFMANTPQFAELRPDYYVLADPHFFRGTENENVASLWKALATVGWRMTLCVPASELARSRDLLARFGNGKSPELQLATFNFVGIEGFDWLENMAYSSGRAMPRPRNVLIPAIMTAMAAGYREIYLTGADHSWLETIRVTDANNVVSVQPHFYADSKTELKRSETEYRGYRLHDILKSFYTAFRSYHRLARYAATRNVSIYNATPSSYIDAFPRRGL